MEPSDPSPHPRPAPSPTAPQAPRQPVPRDPGLQPERTALAWQRTVLSATVGAIVLAATAVRLAQPVIVLAAAGIAIAAMLPFVLRLPEGGLPGHGRLRSWSFLVRIAALVVALGITAVAASVVAWFEITD